MTTALSSGVRSSSKGDVLRLISGSSVAQVISIAFAPLLARVYSPEAFGMAGVFGAVSGILGVIACLRYESAIMLPRDEEEAANVLALSLLSSVLVAAFVGCAIYLAHDVLEAAPSLSGLAPVLWLLPIFILLQGTSMSSSNWSTRAYSVARVSGARVTNGLIGALTSLGLGVFVSPTGGALIAASMIGQGVSTALLSGQTWLASGKVVLRHTSWQGLLGAARRYRRFPAVSSWGALLNALSWYLPIVLLGTYFSAEIVGYYAFGFRLIQLPMNVIGSAIGQVFFRRGAEAATHADLGEVVARLFDRLLLIGLLPCLLLTLIGADLFVFMFGAAWREAGVYSQILAPWALVWFMASPLSAVYLILERQQRELFMHLLVCVGRIAAIFGGALADSPRLAVFLYSLVGVVTYGYLLIDVFDLVGVRLFAKITSALSETVRALAFVFPIVVIGLLGPSVPGSVLLMTSAGVIAAYFFHRRSDLIEANR